MTFSLRRSALEAFNTFITRDNAPSEKASVTRDQICSPGDPVRQHGRDQGQWRVCITMAITSET